MRVPSFSSARPIIVLSIVLCAITGTAAADVGGGRGIPATPWRQEPPKSAEQLVEAQQQAATYQFLAMPAKLVGEDHTSEYFIFERVAVAPLPPHEADVAVHEFVGRSDAGDLITLSFSQIETFTVLSKNDETITLSVTIWPDISPEDLLAKQPTYSELFSNYRREIVIELRLVSDDGRTQAFVGEWTEATLGLGDLPVGVEGTFYLDFPLVVHPLRFWWAIPSVTADEAYPFRLHMAN